MSLVISPCIINLILIREQNKLVSMNKNQTGYVKIIVHVIEEIQQLQLLINLITIYQVYQKHIIMILIVSYMYIRVAAGNCNIELLQTSLLGTMQFKWWHQREGATGTPPPPHLPIPKFGNWKEMAFCCKKWQNLWLLRILPPSHIHTQKSPPPPTEFWSWCWYRHWQLLLS